jgi:peroxiredoxin
MNRCGQVVGITLLACCLWLVGAERVAALEAGDTAPDFSLPATTAAKIGLADYQGKQTVVVFFYIAAFGRAWTTDALAFQLDLPKFEALNAQVLGVSVDWNGANKAWAQEMGVTYPLLSDLQRLVTRAYGVLYDDPTLANDPNYIPLYLRSKGAWFVIDKAGIVRSAMLVPLGQQIVTDEILQVLSTLQQWHMTRRSVQGTTLEGHPQPFPPGGGFRSFPLHGATMACVSPNDRGFSPNMASRATRR